MSQVPCFVHLSVDEFVNVIKNIIERLLDVRPAFIVRRDVTSKQGNKLVKVNAAILNVRLLCCIGELLFFAECFCWNGN